MKNRFTKENLLAQAYGSALMSTVLSLEMPLLATGSVTLVGFCTGFLVSFFASLALKLFTPIISVGQLLAEKAGTKRGTLGFRIASTAVQAVMMGTCMSLLMNWWGMRSVPNLAAVYWKSWLAVYPYVLVSVFLMINVSISTSAMLLGKKKAKRTSKKGKPV